MERNINLQTTAARLRKTFQYPTDESSLENTPEALDEEEQETLITTLATQNETRNYQFRQFLLLLPAISSIPYVLFISFPPRSFRPSTTYVLCLLSLSSLASTAFLVWRTDPSLTGIPVLDSWTGAAASASPLASSPSYGGISQAVRDRRRRRRSSLSAATIEALNSSSPLEKYLPYLNGSLCVLAFLTGYLQHRMIEGRYHTTEMSSVWLGVLPSIIYAAVLVAKVVMAGVDPERELGALRYEFKGA
ncbi:hypothetical protein V8F33_010894 [Rhypophila sp. PSN 637]